jgi:hypothetical protein
MPTHCGKSTCTVVSEFHTISLQADNPCCMHSHQPGRSCVERSQSAPMSLRLAKMRMHTAAQISLRYRSGVLVGQCHLCSVQHPAPSCGRQPLIAPPISYWRS